MSNPFASPEFSQPAAAMSGQMRLKRIGVLSVGVFAGAAGALMGLFAGGLVFLFPLQATLRPLEIRGLRRILGLDLAALFSCFSRPYSMV